MARTHRVHLAPRIIDAARKEAEQSAKLVERWDDDVHGLHVRVTPAGVASFVVRYRVGPERRRMVLGRVGVLTVDQARRDARAALAKVARGEDPQKEKADARKAMTMLELFGTTETAKDKDPKGRTDREPGWYLKTYVRSAGALGAAKTAKGIATDRYYIKKHLRSRPALMKKAVATVTVDDLNAVKADVTPAAWRKLRNILRIAFRHAEEEGAIPRGSSPVAATKAITDKPRKRYLEPGERQRLDAALDRAQEIGGRREGALSASLVRAIRVLLLTGMRRGDVVGLSWEEVNWQRGVIELNKGKTGARDVPLTPQARAYLEAERGPDVRRKGLVCTTAAGTALHPANITRAWISLRADAGLDEHGTQEAVRLHDLRHSWASDAVSAGVPLYTVGKVLGHTQPKTTMRYSHIHDDAMQESLAVAGAAIERATRLGKR